MIRRVVALCALLATPAAAQDFAFPSTAAHHAFWYPTAYKDAGGQDWNCGSIYYSGHGGTDLGGGSWAGMEAGRDVTAAAAGVVEVVEDGWPDDCTTADCPGGGGFGNHVVVLHADGRRTYYAHLKTWSTAVAVGDTVGCGAALGQMGSSGYSTGPHLHFELRVGGASGAPYSGTRTDPFAGPCSPVAASSWTDQGAHGGVPGLACDGQPPCVAVGELSCGVPRATANNAAGSTMTALSYSCTEFFYSGPEIGWTWIAAVTESVTVTATGLGADVDLFVTEGAACAPSACLGSSTNPQTEDEAITFDAVAGQTYTVVVDGWQGATSAVELLVACTPPAPGDDDDTVGDDDDDDSADGDDDDSGSLGAGPAFEDALRRGARAGDGEGCRAAVGGGSPALAAVAISAALVRRRRRSGGR